MQTGKIISLYHHFLAAEIAEYLRKKCCDNDAELINIKKLTRRFGISESSLQKAFKKKFGVSVHSFVIKERMKKICALLEDSHLTIKVISMEAGYTALSNFSRDFSRHMGVSPSLYRTKNRAKEELKEILQILK